MTHHGCTVRGQLSKLSLRSIASWKYSATSLQLTLPTVWIEVFKLLRCHQQSQRPLLSVVSPDVLAHGAQGVAEDNVRDQALHRGRQAQSRASFGVVSLLCVLEVSPTGWSSLEVTHRRLVLSGCAPPHIIPNFVHVAPVCSIGEFCTLTSRLSGLIRVPLCSPVSRLTRFHLQLSFRMSKKDEARVAVVQATEMSKAEMRERRLCSRKSIRGL